MTGQNRHPVIIVGVDGSASSAQAVRWALEQARLTGAELHPVIAWEIPATFGYTPAFDDVDLEAEAGKALDRVLSDVVDADSPVPVVRRVVRGHPAATLLAESHGAELLVVGSRGHGTLVGMLLGSVSQHCVQHASCPVVVVHHT